MARVTVEDCIEKVQNRFKLVLVAAQRARGISSGAELSVDRDNDKNPVVALREIAEEAIDLEQINENLIRGLQKHPESDEPEGENEDMEFIGDDFTGETVKALEPAAGNGGTVPDGAAGEETEVKGFDGFDEKAGPKTDVEPPAQEGE